MISLFLSEFRNCKRRKYSPEFLDRDHLERREPQLVDVFAIERAGFFDWIVLIVIAPQAIHLFQIHIPQKLVPRIVEPIHRLNEVSQ